MATYLVAVRHGKPVSEGYPDVDLRPLSDEGKKAQKKVAQDMLQNGISIDRILTSPLLRAQQTAEVLAEIFEAPIADEPALGNDFNADTLLKQIPSSDTDQTICFVGHAPSLAEFVNTLVGKEVLDEGLSKSAAAVVVFFDEIAYGKAEFVHYYQA